MVTGTGAGATGARSCAHAGAAANRPAKAKDCSLDMISPGTVIFAPACRSAAAAAMAKRRIPSLVNRVVRPQAPEKRARMADQFVSSCGFQLPLHAAGLFFLKGRK
jgi:hypothetical protein